MADIQRAYDIAKAKDEQRKSQQFRADRKFQRHCDKLAKCTRRKVLSAAKKGNRYATLKKLKTYCNLDAEYNPNDLNLKYLERVAEELRGRTELNEFKFEVTMTSYADIIPDPYINYYLAAALKPLPAKKVERIPRIPQ